MRSMKKLKSYLALGLAVLITSTEVLTAQAMPITDTVPTVVETQGQIGVEETNVSESSVESQKTDEESVAQEESEPEGAEVEEPISVEESKEETSYVETMSEEVTVEDASDEESISEEILVENASGVETLETDSEKDSLMEETEIEEITEEETTEEIVEEEIAVFSLELEENQYINYATAWKYLDNDTDPASSDNRTSWTLGDFDDSTWKTSEGLEAKFGAKNGEVADMGNNSIPSVLLNQYNAEGKNVKTFFFRTSFELAEIPANVKLVGTLKYDDAAIVYINGEKIAAYDEPTNGFSANLEYGGSNAGSPKEVTFKVSPDCLKIGSNIVAVEIHQGREASSDVYFEMSSLSLEEYVVLSEETALTQKAIALSVGADETSRNITWYADLETAGTVQYAVKSDEDFPTEYIEVQATAIETEDEGFYSNQATLANLAYDTEYVYRLVNGETVSEVYSFKTGDVDSFSFLLAGDPQIGSGNLQTGIDGWENTLNVATEKFPEVDFLLSAGDQVNTASNEEQYAGYLEHDVLKTLPMATVIGNHDSGSAAYSQHFNTPNETVYGATAAGVDYWYVYNNTLFMHMNSNNMSAAEHKSFMEQAIAANPDVAWKVVSFHHSIFTVASHAYDKDILARREQYVPIFEELDIDVVLMGHDHVYARTYMMDGFTPIVTEEVENSVTNPEGILYITANSASGSKFYNIKNEVFEYSAVQSQEKVPNISYAEVTENSFKITTYRTNDMSVVDTFEIIHEEKSADIEQPDVPSKGEISSDATNNSSTQNNNQTTQSNKQSTKQTVVLEEPTALSGVLGNGMIYQTIALNEKSRLQAKLLQKYHGQKTYVMLHAGNGIGFSIDATQLGTVSQDIDLQTVVEKYPQFAEGFDTIKVSPVTEVALPFKMAVHVNVGVENIGKVAYIFQKNLATGIYELLVAMSVNEIGNVAVETEAYSDIMILVKK